MKSERETLRIIEALPEPRHLFILPGWTDSMTLDRLMEQGYLSCAHLQRDSAGAILVAMDLKLTEKGVGLLRSNLEWKELALKGSLAAASFTVMSLLILYLG